MGERFLQSLGCQSDLGGAGDESLWECSRIATARVALKRGLSAALGLLYPDYLPSGQVLWGGSLVITADCCDTQAAICTNTDVCICELQQSTAAM